MTVTLYSLFITIELNLNLTLRDRAIEQAGIVNNSNFTIASFNYNVSIVTNLIQKHLRATIFTGKSVSGTCIILL